MLHKGGGVGDRTHRAKRLIGDHNDVLDGLETDFSQHDFDCQLMISYQFIARKNSNFARF